jgi:hypothetical protein
METLLILAAIAVAGLALASAAVMSAQARRPPLRMQREDDLADGYEELLIQSLRPAARSPIDRTGPIVDAEWREARAVDTPVIDSKSIEAEMIEAKLIEDPSEMAPGKAGPRGRRGSR